METNPYQSSTGPPSPSPGSRSKPVGIPISLRAAIVCGVLLMLLGMVPLLIARAIADAIVHAITHAAADERHSAAYDTLSTFTNAVSILTMTLALAIVVLVRYAVRTRAPNGAAKA